MANIGDDMQVEDMHLFVKGVEGLVRFKARSTAVLEAGLRFPTEQAFDKRFHKEIYISTHYTLDIKHSP